MAFLIGPAYNLNSPVGQGLANLGEDVRLVQTMLLELHAARPGWGPPVPLTANGSFTPALTEWIRAFQQKVNSRNANALVVDGKIHPMQMVTKRDFRSKFPSGHFSTMYALNDFLRLVNKTLHNGLADRLSIPEPRQEAVAS